ncbi:UPF0481 protein At3g47200-like [Magnolia sinica]|uniref:UPF0481 protein At3g47200-like n=1 Tax=Magnolia sinica TaxID=86752 RepID=UPI00265B135A|nr:UPF0481 protein At3g47200-like [Magnolia sinica]
MSGDWVTNVDSEIQNRSLPIPIWNKRSIYKIAENFGNPERKEAYKPKLVSFGPYHHGESQLKPVEEHKYRVLIHFLGRANKSACDCVAAVGGVVQQLMDSYDQLAEEWRDRKRFLQLMIQDGCFMIEILRNVGESGSGYSDDDPIFSNHARLCNLPRIKRDMLMIENQLPLLLLKTLLAFEARSPPDEEYINKLVMKLFDPGWSTGIIGQRHHVLDVVRESMLQVTVPVRRSICSRNRSMGQSTSPQIFNRSGQPDASTGQNMCQPPFELCKRTSQIENDKHEVIWPVTQLHEAGIRFKKIENTQSLKSIKFDKGFLFLPGTLSLPVIEVDDATESKFLNLIAFEQLHAGAGSEVSSYVSFMDNIIDTEKDVILLNKKGIIKNFVGTDEAVAKLFNGIAYDVPIDPNSSLGNVHKDVTDYCKSYCRQSFANLWHTYFSSPWSCISLFAAIFLLCLTVTLAVYQILDFYRN